MDTRGMRGLQYRQVDVFANRPLSGNGLVVFWHSPGLTDVQMQGLTVELRQFESIFLEPTGEKRRFLAKVFTMEEQLDFAGHPLLGAAAVLHEKYGETETESWVIQLPKYSIRVETARQATGYHASMDQPKPEFFPVDPSIAQVIAESLNLTVWDLYPELPLEVVSTGLPYLLVPLSRDIAKAKVVNPHFQQILQSLGAKFVYVCEVDQSEGRTWDNAGVVEDIATGSAAGVVAAYLCKHGRLKIGQRLLINQGRFVGRPSQLFASVHGITQGFDKVQVSGRVQMVSSGVLD